MLQRVLKRLRLRCSGDISVPKTSPQSYSTHHWKTCERRGADLDVALVDFGLECTVLMHRRQLRLARTLIRHRSLRCCKSWTLCLRVLHGMSSVLLLKPPGVRCYLFRVTCSITPERHFDLDAALHCITSYGRCYPRTLHKWRNQS